MSDKSNVSTEDTPPPRNEISVVTEENQATPAPDPAAAPSGVKTSESQSTDDPASSSDNQDNDGDKKPRRNRSAERRMRRMSKDIEEANTRANAAEASNTELQDRLDTLEAKLDAGPKPDKPKLADYNDPDKFAADYAAWQAAKAPPAKKPKADPPPKKASTEKQPAPELVELHKTGKARFGDEFEEVLHQDDLPLSKHMIEYIFDSELGPELVMWIEDNRDDAQEIYKLGAVRAIKALDKIEATLQPGDGDRSGTIDVKENKKPEKPKDRKVSKAKEPPGDGVKTSTVDADSSLNNLSMDDYASRRKKTEREKRGIYNR